MRDMGKYFLLNFKVYFVIHKIFIVKYILKYILNLF